MQRKEIGLEKKSHLVPSCPPTQAPSKVIHKWKIFKTVVSHPGLDRLRCAMHPFFYTYPCQVFRGAAICRSCHRARGAYPEQVRMCMHAILRETAKPPKATSQILTV
uniref:Uncharacterized protein n=1 Tax=Neolamprologus brichardi TaxID=32507 RepID=A0A3Q4HEY8_NEOBR